MTRQPSILEAWPVLVDEDSEVCVDVHFHFYKGSHGSYYDPPESDSVEIVEVKYHSGARHEVEEEIMMASVKGLMDMDDSEFLREMEDACLQMIADEEDRMADAHYDAEMEARIDAAVAQSQEEDA